VNASVDKLNGVYLQTLQHSSQYEIRMRV